MAEVHETFYRKSGLNARKILFREFKKWAFFSPKTEANSYDFVGFREDVEDFLKERNKMFPSVFAPFLIAARLR
jgi:hypothetical protein